MDIVAMGPIARLARALPDTNFGVAIVANSKGGEPQKHSGHCTDHRWCARIDTMLAWLLASGLVGHTAQCAL